MQEKDICCIKNFKNEGLVTDEVKRKLALLAESGNEREVFEEAFWNEEANEFWRGEISILLDWATTDGKFSIDEFKKYAAEKQVNCEFAGFMEYGDMMANLMACDCAVNPIIGKSVSSIINKVSDYAMAGVPVINTQNSPEYRELLEEYECGINCENGNAQAMADAILKLYNDEKLKNTMGENIEF